MMNFNYKLMVKISVFIIIVGYTVFTVSLGIGYANAFFAGFFIIFGDLFFLFRYLKKALKGSTVGLFIMQSIIRWLFVGFCIYIAIAVFKLYNYGWAFIMGIILPFVGVFIAGIYEIFRGKEDGTSS